MLSISKGYYGMAQSFPRLCQRCGTAVANNQAFCPNCGTPLSGAVPVNAPNPHYQQGYAPNASPQQGYPQASQGGQQPPAFAQPQKKRRTGCIVGTILLLLLLVLVSTGGYFGWKWYTGSHLVGSVQNVLQTGPQSPITTTPINATVNYASVDVTIINAQQAKSFVNDNSSTAPGTVRINIHAVQSDVNDVGEGSRIDPNYDYPSSFSLILPGGNNGALVGSKDVNGPTHAGSQTTWLDFTVPTTVQVNQLILHIGKDTQEQIDIPLTGHADVSKYQAKQSTLNTRVPFGSMFWTLTTVTVKLSDSATQADKGNDFIILGLSIDNPSSEGNNGYPPDYMRLQCGSTSIVLSNNLIGNASANTTAVKGIVSFKVPQGTSSCSLILLPGHTPGATSQAEIPFQVPA
jgi:hypothetical protein